MSTINLQTFQAIILLARLLNQISTGQVAQQPVAAPPATLPYFPPGQQSYVPQFPGYPAQYLPATAQYPAQYAPQFYQPQAQAQYPTQYAPQFYQPQAQAQYPGTSYLQQAGLGQQFGLGGQSSTLFQTASGLVSGFDPAKGNALALARDALNSQYGRFGNPVVQRILAGQNPFG
jgi:hypothetical protein